MKETPTPWTWRVIRLDKAVFPGQKSVGDDPFGVIVSNDEMLRQTHTVLFCLLIDGYDKDDNSTTVEPWHLVVTLDKAKPNQVLPAFKQCRLSTKLLLPAAFDDFDKDRRDHGRLDPQSIRDAKKRLRKWVAF
jgi:hypothetical protein